MLKYLTSVALTFGIFQASADCGVTVKTGFFSTVLSSVQLDGMNYGPCVKLDRNSPTSKHCFPLDVTADRYVCLSPSQMSSGDVCVAFLPSVQDAYIYGTRSERHLQTVRCPRASARSLDREQ